MGKPRRVHKKHKCGNCANWKKSEYFKCQLNSAGVAWDKFDDNCKWEQKPKKKGRGER